MSNKTSWELKLLFQSDTDPKIAQQKKIIQTQADNFVKKWHKNQTIATDPEVLLQALNDYEKIMSGYGVDGSYGYYFWLKENLDQISPEIKAARNKAIEFHNTILNQLQFFDLRISKIDPKLYNRFLNYTNLKPYKHYLESAFKLAPHQLSEPEEKILNLKAQVSHGNWVKMVSSFLSKEEIEILDQRNKKSKKNFPELLSLSSSNKKRVRDNAALALNQILDKYKEIAENELNSVLLNKKINDELRNFSRPDSARHLSDDIDSSVVDTLVKSVTAKFNIPAKIYQLKAKLLRVPKLKYHERNVEVVFGKEPEFNFDKTVTLIKEVLEQLDPEFLDIFNNYLNSGQIDVFPKKGKRDGAFCVSWTKSLPVFILLNHNKKLRDVTTLAHELGHGINMELIKQSQNGLNFGTPLSTTEVASTFFEDFVFEKLMQGVGDRERLTLMVSKLSDDVSTIFRQIACYNFETELHKNFRQQGYLSAKEIGRLFQKHMQSYMGKYVEQSKGSENWWVYWSHIRSFFYNYSYANGLLISKALQRKVRTNPKFIKDVKLFLSAGTSESPVDTFKKLGIDITKQQFWEEGLKEVEDLLKETEKLAKKLKKI